MKFLLKSLYFLLLYVTAFEFALGLRCYSCMYFSEDTENETVPLPGPIIVPACKYGHTQNETLTDECYEGDKPPNSKSSCGIFHVEGNLLDSSDEAMAEVTLRSCMYVTPDQRDECFDWTAEEIGNVTGLPPEVKRAVDRINPQARGSVCSCNSDNCNVEINYGCRDGVCDGGIREKQYEWHIFWVLCGYIMVNKYVIKVTQNAY